jgi:hypothetical protein
MVYFQTKNSNLGLFLLGLGIENLGISYYYLVCYTKKNLANPDYDG